MAVESRRGRDPRAELDPGSGLGAVQSAKKNVHEFNSGAQSNVGWNAQHINSVNIHLYRYADMPLLLAEAEVETGTLENARAIVNEIRARAGAVPGGRAPVWTI